MTGMSRGETQMSVVMRITITVPMGVLRGTTGVGGVDGTTTRGAQVKIYKAMSGRFVQVEARG